MQLNALADFKSPQFDYYDAYKIIFFKYSSISSVLLNISFQPQLSSNVPLHNITDFIFLGFSPHCIPIPSPFPPNLSNPCYHFLPDVYIGKQMLPHTDVYRKWKNSLQYEEWHSGRRGLIGGVEKEVGRCFFGSSWYMQYFILGKALQTSGFPVEWHKSKESAPYSPTPLLHVFLFLPFSLSSILKFGGIGRLRATSYNSKTKGNCYIRFIPKAHCWSIKRIII